MKHLFCLCCWLIPAARICAQKPAIDTSVYAKWPAVAFAAISDDGKYVLYTIENDPPGSRTLVIRDIAGTKSLELPGADRFSWHFTGDGRHVVFQKGDSAGVVLLDSMSARYIPHVRSVKLPKKGEEPWVGLLWGGPGGKLSINNLRTDRQYGYSKVRDYFFSDDGKVLLVETEDSAAGLSLEWVDLAEGQRVTIGEWRKGKMGNVVFDTEDEQVAFSVENGREKTVWHYRRTGGGKASPLVVDSNWRPDAIQGFSKDGSRLFFSFIPVEQTLKPKPGVARVDVWSWTDAKLQSQQLEDAHIQRSYRAVIGIQNGRAVRLQQAGDMVRGSTDEYLLVDHYGSEEAIDAREAEWNPASRADLFLVSVKDGSRKLVDKDARFLALSPGSKYVIFGHRGSAECYSYLVSGGIIVNITKNIPSAGFAARDKLPEESGRSFKIDGWLGADEKLLLNDDLDVWQVDLSGKMAPVNLTNGYGRKHHIAFEPVGKGSGQSYTRDEKIVLSAFNRDTKQNGFYTMTAGERNDPERMCMGNYFYYAANAARGLENGSNFMPVKAGGGQAWVVRRMSATESPNYFFTVDFRTFGRLSDLHPEKSYNWYTTELYTWRAPDGGRLQGVLYKPEDFDPRKKYPVIFYYYETSSDNLNIYRAPAFAGSGINIASYASNGYLVFTPDIRYKMGEPGQGAYDAVTSAAADLAGLPYVDSGRMGLVGISFGGYETNYIVTHSHLFAAACTQSGQTDMISFHGSLSEIFSGNSLAGYTEYGQGRMGATPWDRPDLYVKNSPIFRANRVTTPLLMMYNKQDRRNFVQGVELFTALRRLGKRAWMLQYDDGGHWLTGKTEQRDLSTRMAQYFDHFLKGAPAPVWMTRGVPAREKGVETGLEMDSTEGKK